MIERRGRSTWSPDEDAIIAACYPKVGATWDGYETLLPNRSTLAIRMRAQYIGVHYDGPTKVPDHGNLERVDEGAAIAVAALSSEQRETLALLVLNANAKIDEAIEHAEWCAENSCGECAEDHAQLAEWLRELAQWKQLAESIKLPDGYPMVEFHKPEDLKQENEKLRELVREMSLPYKYGDFDCGLCPHTDKCWDSETLEFSPDGCAILQMVRELGIECE